MQQSERQPKASAPSSDSLSRRLPNIRPSRDLRHSQGPSSFQQAQRMSGKISSAKQITETTAVKQRDSSSSSSDSGPSKKAEQRLRDLFVPESSSRPTPAFQPVRSGLNEDPQPPFDQRLPGVSEQPVPRSEDQTVYSPEAVPVADTKKIDASRVSSSSSSQASATMFPFFRPAQSVPDDAPSLHPNPEPLAVDRSVSMASSSSIDKPMKTIIPIGQPREKSAVQSSNAPVNDHHRADDLSISMRSSSSLEKSTKTILQIGLPREKPVLHPVLKEERKRSLSSCSEKSADKYSQSEVQILVEAQPLQNALSSERKPIVLAPKPLHSSASDSFSSSEEKPIDAALPIARMPVAPAAVPTSQKRAQPSSSSSSESIYDIRGTRESHAQHSAKFRPSLQGANVSQPIEEHPANEEGELPEIEETRKLRDFDRFLRYYVTSISASRRQGSFIQRICSCFGKSNSTPASEVQALLTLAEAPFDPSQSFHQDLQAYVLRWLKCNDDVPAEFNVEGFTSALAESPVPLSSALACRHSCLTLFLLAFLIDKCPNLATALYFERETHGVFRVLLYLCGVFLELLKMPVQESFYQAGESGCLSWCYVYAGLVVRWLSQQPRKALDSDSKDPDALQNIGRENLSEHQVIALDGTL